MRTWTALLALALATTTTHAAEPVRREAAAALQQTDPARMTVQEMERFRLPADAKVGAQTAGPALAALPVELRTPDLVVRDPYIHPGPTVGAAVGYPQVTGGGIRVDHFVENRGNVAAPTSHVKVECSVLNAPAGAGGAYLQSHWCGGFPAAVQLYPLAPGATSPAIKTFVGLPLFPCGYPTAPRPRFVITVDAQNQVPETGLANGNNVRTIDLCLK